MFIIIMIVCFILLFLLGIEFLIIAFHESVGWGLACLFFKPADLFFLIIHWDIAHRNFFKTLFVYFVMLVSLLFHWGSFGELDLFGAIESPSQSIVSILTHVNDYSGRRVSLRGTVSDYREKVSRSGNPYTVFTLSDGAGWLTIHYRGHAGSYNGQFVAVKGTFNAVKHVAGRSYYNQVEASSVSVATRKEEERVANHALANENYRKLQEQFVPPKERQLIEIGGGRKVASNSLLLAVHKNKLKKIQVSGFGRVTKILADDLKGDKHQRFLLRITPDLTILVAHNIDLAPRVSPLKVGDTIHFYGQYEWTAEGGVVHWTHLDPSNRHKGGWLERNGQKFQ